MTTEEEKIAKKREATRRWKQANKERVAAKDREYKAANKVRISEYNKEYHIKVRKKNGND